MQSPTVHSQPLPVIGTFPDGQMSLPIPKPMIRSTRMNPNGKALQKLNGHSTAPCNDNVSERIVMTRPMPSLQSTYVVAVCQNWKAAAWKTYAHH